MIRQPVDWQVQMRFFRHRESNHVSWWSAALAVAALAACPTSFAAVSGAPAWPIVFTELPRTAVAHATARGNGMLRGEYGEGGKLVVLERPGATRILTPEFASAADPAVSFDGRRVLFAGKKRAGDTWNIFEVSIDGTGLRQITRGRSNSRSPIYQPPIFYLDDPGPMPQIAYVSDAPALRAESAADAATALYSARMDGSGLRRLTYLPSGAFDPAILPDGRMLFSGWVRNHPDDVGSGRIELMATNIDGTDYATFSGGQGRRIKQMACVTVRDLVVFIEGDSSTWDGAGSLGSIVLRRNLHGYRRIPLAAGYVYHSPSPLPDGTVLLTRRAERSPGAHVICRFDPTTGAVEEIYSRPGYHLMQARAVAPRRVPDGRSSVVDEKQKWAKLYCLNLYQSDLQAREWEPGTVKRVRLLEALPRPYAAEDDCEDDARIKSPCLHTRLLGEANVEADGSFHIQLPPNLPVRIQALDADGMALRSSAWLWAKNKEQRGCIGCHEDGERTPENVMATALTHPAAMLTLPPERRRTVEFDRDVLPILNAKCATAACHGQPAATPRMSPGSYSPYESLLAKGTQSDSYRYVTPGVARTSPLVWAVLGRHTSRPWDRRGNQPLAPKMPPVGSPQLSAEEIRAIVEWIDFGAYHRCSPSRHGTLSDIAAGGAE